MLISGTFMEYRDRRVTLALGVVQFDQPAVSVRIGGWGFSFRDRSRIGAMDRRRRTHYKATPTQWATPAIAVSDAPAGFGPRKAPKKNHDANPLKGVRAGARNLAEADTVAIPPMAAVLRVGRFDFRCVFRYNSPLRDPRGNDPCTRFGRMTPRGDRFPI